MLQHMRFWLVDSPDWWDSAMLLRLANVPLKLRCVYNEHSGNFKASDARVYVFAMYVDSTKKDVASYLSLQTIQSMLKCGSHPSRPYLSEQFLA